MIEQEPITIEEFEKIRAGHRVRFSPRDAIGGSRRLKKSIFGRVRSIDSKTGIAQIDDWLVPVKKLERAGGGAYREWSRAARTQERARVYGQLKPEDKRKLEACAQDARRAHWATSTYSGPVDQKFLAEAKRRREALLRQHGIEDTTDLGQCKGLPVLVARALEHGTVPELQTLTYVSADKGDVGVGDYVSIGGQRFKILGYDSQGRLKLKNSHEVTYPAERIPRDKTGKVETVFAKLDAKRRTRIVKTRDQMRFKVQQRKERLRLLPKRSRPAAKRSSRKPKKSARRPLKIVSRTTRRIKFAPRLFSIRLPKFLKPTEVACMCLARDKYGRFASLKKRLPRAYTLAANPRKKSSRIVVEKDLLGRKVARLAGYRGKAEQIPLFARSHDLTPEEMAERRETERWRIQRQKQKGEGQRDLFENAGKSEKFQISPLAVIGGLAALYFLFRKPAAVNG